jgi:hypothetical protein
MASFQGLTLDSNSFPTWEEVCDIRRAQPGPQSIKAVRQVIESLAQEAVKNGFAINPRRIAQWTRILYRPSVYITGSADFPTVPEDAVRILKYAYPNTDADQANTWSQVATAVVDIVGAAIEGALAEAYKIFKAVSFLKSPDERSSRLGEMGKILSNTQASINQIAGTDPRGAEAMQILTNWFSSAVRGEKISQ